MSFTPYEPRVRSSSSIRSELQYNRYRSDRSDEGIVLLICEIACDTVMFRSNFLVEYPDMAGTCTRTTIPMLVAIPLQEQLGCYAPSESRKSKKRRVRSFVRVPARIDTTRHGGFGFGNEVCSGAIQYLALREVQDGQCGLRRTGSEKRLAGYQRTHKYTRFWLNGASLPQSSLQSRPVHFPPNRTMLIY